MLQEDQAEASSSSGRGETRQNIEDKNVSLTSARNSTGISNHGHFHATYLTNTVTSGHNNTVTNNITNITSQATPSPRPERIEFNIQESVSTFTARQDFLTNIHQDIFHTQKTSPPLVRSRALVICGMAGVGKTQAVRKYIELNKIEYDHVLWISAESYDDAIDCFLRLAAKLSMDVNFDGKRKTEKDILAEIYDYVCQNFSLIVFDNVESSKSDEDKPGLQLLLPLAINTGWKVPAIIVTTRYRDWPNYTFRELTGFDLSESLALLSALEFEETEDNRQMLEEIANICQGLPLALQQVISFFRIKIRNCAALDEQPYTLLDFLNDVTSKKRKKFMSTKPPESTYPAVYTLFEMTFEQIGSMKNGELALQCMDVMAILNPDCIPTLLIKQFFSHTKNKLVKALILLHDYTLVTRCDKHYQIHRMVQAVRAESTNQDGSSFVKHNFDTILDSLAPFLETLQANSEQVHEILNNLVRLHDQAGEVQSEKFMKFQEILAEQLRRVGSYRTAIDLHRKIVQTNENIWGANHANTIVSKHALTDVLTKQGLYDEAEKLCTEVSKMYMKVLGPGHLATLSSKTGLALVLCEQGKYEQSEKLQNEVLKAKINLHGPKSQGTLNTKTNLAAVLVAQGKYDEAQKLLQDVLKTQICMLGPEHSDSLNTKNTLGEIFRAQRNYDKAEEFHNDVLKIRIIKLGPDHPDTLNSKNNLALALDAQGKYNKAKKLYNDVLKTRIKVLGPEHPYTLNTQNNLADVFRMQKKFVEAQELHNQVLKVRIKTLGPEHPDTLTSKNNLAAVLSASGKYDEAKKLYNGVLKSLVKVLGPDHPRTLIAKTNLAEVFLFEGEYSAVEDLLKEIMKIQIRVLGPDHPNTLTTKQRLIFLFISQGKVPGTFTWKS